MRGGGPRQEATRLDWSDMLFEPNADAGYGRGDGTCGTAAAIEWLRRSPVRAAVAVARCASLLRCTATFA